MKDKIQIILELQGKVNTLTQKSENIVDWGAEIKNLQFNQKRLEETNMKFNEKNKHEIDDIRKDLINRDAYLTSEIDKF